MKINFKKLNENAAIPVYGTEFSAGADLRACISEDIMINPGKVSIISTGISCEIPERFFGMICSRSGLAAKNAIVTLNSPGIVDADYRGEIKLIMINHSEVPFKVEHGMRLAQLILVPFEKGDWNEVQSLSESTRGENGIGSTGVR